MKKITKILSIRIKLAQISVPLVFYGFGAISAICLPLFIFLINSNYIVIKYFLVCTPLTYLILTYAICIINISSLDKHGIEFRK